MYHVCCDVTLVLTWKSFAKTSTSHCCLSFSSKRWY